MKHEFHTHEYPQPFAQNYDRLLKRLKLRGMQPKTIEAHSHRVKGAVVEFPRTSKNTDM